MSVMTPTIILAGILLLLTIAFIVKGFIIVNQSEAVVIERLGSYNRTLEHGVNFIIPILEKTRPIKIYRYESSGITDRELTRRMVTETKIDKRETVLNFPKQPVVTNDNVSVQIDGALYFQIEEPDKAVYAVENLVQSVEILAKTKLRSVVGEQELDQLFSARDEVNQKLLAVMDEAGDKWGVKVTRVEIQDITIPEDVEDAMHQQMAAERTRRAKVTEAEGQKAAEIAKADGEKQAAVLRAQGDKEAINEVLSAGQEAGADVEPSRVMEYIIANRYVDQLPNIAKDGERIMVPYEATALLGSIQSIQDLFPGAGAALNGGASQGQSRRAITGGATPKNAGQQPREQAAETSGSDQAIQTADAGSEAGSTEADASAETDQTETRSTPSDRGSA